MAQGFLVPLPTRLFDSAGLIGTNWKIYTWVANGAFSTPLTTYSDAGLTSANTNPIIADASGYFRAFVAATTLLDVSVQNADGVPQYTFPSLEPMTADAFNPATSYNRTGATDSNGTYASGTFTSPTVTGDAGGGIIFSKTVLFTEDATHTTHTGTIVVPAGATLLDIYVVPEVLWTATGTVTFKCGDANSANGWFLNTNLKATDLILGERFQASNANNWGGLNGAYLTTAGRFGQQSGTVIGGYCPTAASVIGVVTVVTPATTAGRTRMTVLWTVGQAVAPVVT